MVRPPDISIIRVKYRSKSAEHQVCKSKKTAKNPKIEKFGWKNGGKGLY